MPENSVFCLHLLGRKKREHQPRIFSTPLTPPSPALSGHPLPPVKTDGGRGRGQNRRLSNSADFPSSIAGFDVTFGRSPPEHGPAPLVPNVWYRNTTTFTKMFVRWSRNRVSRSAVWERPTTCTLLFVKTPASPVSPQRLHCTRGREHCDGPVLAPRGCLS